MGVFREYQHFVFTVIFSAALLCTESEIVAASKKVDAIIENKDENGLSAFGAVVHALSAVPEFKLHYKDGQKNGTKRKLQSLFHKLKSKKSIKTHTGKQFARFFEKKAGKLHIRNDIFLATHFLLAKCGIPGLIQTKKITFYPSMDHSLKDSEPFTWLHTENECCVLVLPVRKKYTSKSLSQLLNEKKEISVSGFRPEESFKRHGIYLSKEIYEAIKKRSCHHYDCDVEFLLRIQDEKSTPKILPIYLDRIYKEYPRANSLEIIRKRIIPSTTIEIPLENTPTKRAVYRLVSMIGEKVKPYQGSYIYHPYTIVPIKKKAHTSWVFYDNHRVRTIKHPKRASTIRVNPAMKIRGLHNSISKQANLFFYQFVGYKD